MSKNTKLSLEKEKLRLKIKQQEYEIKKTMLDLKDRYHPLNVALNMAGDYLATNNEPPLVGKEAKSIGQTTTTATRENNEGNVSGLTNFLGQLIALFQNYIELANEAAHKKRKQLRQNEEVEEYIIGRDDQ